MLPADLIEYFFIDRLPVYRLTFSFKFFDHSLRHFSLNYLLARYALRSFAESAEILINSHYKPPMLMLYRFNCASAPRLQT